MKIKYLGIMIGITLGLSILGGCGNQDTNNVNIEKGMELIEQRDYQGALDSFEAAIVYNEDKELLYRGEGIAFIGNKEYDKAVDSLLKALSYAKGNVSSLEFDINYYLADAYTNLGQYENAIDVYSAIIGLKSEEVDAFYLRACGFLQIGQYDNAVADFEKAFSLEPDNKSLVINAYLNMENCGYGEEGKIYIQDLISSKSKKLSDTEKGTMYFYLQDYDNARIYLEAGSNQGNGDATVLLGKTYEILGDKNYASIIYKSFLDKNEPRADVYNNLGTCLMDQGKYEEALEAFELGIALGESDSLGQLRFNQIVTLEYLGNFEKAKQNMEQYLVDYPDDEDALREYEFLKSR